MLTVCKRGKYQNGYVNGSAHLHASHVLGLHAHIFTLALQKTHTPAKRHRDTQAQRKAGDSNPSQK